MVIFTNLQWITHQKGDDHQLTVKIKYHLLILKKLEYNKDLESVTNKIILYKT